MMLLRNLSLIATISILSFVSAPVLSEPVLADNLDNLEMAQNPPGKRGEGWNRDRFMENLNLTDTQKNQIEAIKNDQEDEMQQLKEQLRSKENEFRNLMASNSSDTQLRNKHREILDLRQKLGNLHFESMLKIRAVLTPAQRSNLAQMKPLNDDARPGFGRKNWR